jgi:dihydroorotase
MLLIKNGYMIDPKSGVEGNYDILSEDGRITKIAECIDAPEGCEVIDAEGLTVGPGLVDVHVHFRDPGFTSKEDIITGANAAKAGGFTTVVMMANTRPTIDSVDTLAYCLEKGAATGIHVTSCANVTCGMMGEILTNMEKLVRAGAVGFTDDGIPLRNPEIVKEAMIRTRDLGVPISFHEEDPDYIENNGINHGKASEYYHIGGSDRMAEIVMVERDLGLALETGASIEIQHISTKEAVELVRKAKAKAALGNIHAEATPHHFSLTEEAAIRYGSYAKMNPPLREEADRMAIIEGLADGTIDIIATDHAPHTTAEKKERKLTEAPSGIIGLETSLALGITELVHKGYLSMRTLLERMSCAPASMYHFDAGYIAEGGPCDLVIFDENEKFTAGGYASKAENSPFTGMELTGRVHMTICGGKVVYKKV